MIVWLAGPPGAGKTETAQRLANRGLAVIVDPEAIGQRIIAATPAADYQDLAVWRDSVVKEVVAAARRRNVAVPMSLAPEAGIEILRRLRATGIPLLHLFLSAPQAIHAARIRARGQAVEWCIANLLRLSVPLPGATRIDTAALNADAVAEEVVARMRALGSDSASSRTVLVDMDGVLADFDSAVLAHLRTLPGFAAAPARINWSVGDDYPMHRDEVEDYITRERFFASLPLVQDAAAGWQRIIDAGYAPRVCTAPLTANRHCEAEKREWVVRHLVPLFGPTVAEEMIVTAVKADYAGIALIDDRPTIHHAAVASWQHVVFDRPYNGTSAGPRLRGWRDPRLPRILDETATRYAAALR